MEQQITICGLVATTPRHLVTQDGLPITSFRIAQTGNEFTNWFTVTAYRQLAINTALSVSKGDRVIVTGSLKIRDWDNGDRAGTSVEIEASVIGHDLSLGTSVYTRTTFGSAMTDAQAQAVEEAKAEVEAEASVEAHSCDCGNCNR